MNVEIIRLWKGTGAEREIAISLRYVSVPTTTTDIKLVDSLTFQSAQSNA